jgi:carbon-monoxide dehydrogenase medium subunit
MKPAPFRYERADSLRHALDLLSEQEEEAKILAGGQSLIPMMNFRLARPDVLIDIKRVAELDRIHDEPHGLRIGALARHRSFEDRTRFSGAWSIIPETAHLVGHYPIRVRGTFGGSIAHADPAAEWPALGLALDASLRLMSADVERTVAIGDFLIGPFAVDLSPEELLAEVELPRPPSGARMKILEFARRAGDFAVVLAIVGVQIEGDTCAWVRIVVGGVGGTPLRLAEAESVLVGGELDPGSIEQTAIVARDAVDPLGDIHGSADFRRHLTQVLVARGLESLLPTPRQ